MMPSLSYLADTAAAAVTTGPIADDFERVSHQDAPNADKTTTTTGDVDSPTTVRLKGSDGLEYVFPAGKPHERFVCESCLLVANPLLLYIDEPHAPGSIGRATDAAIASMTDMSRLLTLCKACCGHGGAAQRVVGTESSAQKLLQRDFVDKFEVACPNGCRRSTSDGEKITAAGLQAHRAVCPAEMVQCPLHDIGCPARMKRADIDAHLAACSLRSDNVQVLIALRKLSKRVTKQTHRLASLKRQLNCDDNSDGGSVDADSEDGEEVDTDQEE